MKKGFEEFLRNSAADVVCLQEIKARPEQVSLDLPEGMQAYWNPADRPGYSGTMTLSSVEPVNITTGIGVPEGDGEGRVQTLEFSDFFLVNVYTPNSQNELRRLDFRIKDWDPAFREHCVGLSARKPVMFCGDLNVAHQEIDIANPSSNRRNAGFTDEERAEFSAHIEAGFIDTFRHFCDEPKRYSWWSYRAGARARNVGWRIDYFCASSGFTSRLKDAFIWPDVLGSDHCPVGVDLVDGGC